MKSAAMAPASYVASISAEHRPDIDKLRKLIKKSVPKAHEGMGWGLLLFSLDERPFAGLASQKNYLSLYLMDLYSRVRLCEKHAATLSKLKMGKSCISIRLSVGG
jgi:hypothetical protein